MQQLDHTTGIEMSPWKPFRFENGRMVLIHLPTSTVLEVSQRIFEAALEVTSQVASDVASDVALGVTGHPSETYSPSHKDEKILPHPIPTPMFNDEIQSAQLPEHFIKDQDQYVLDQTKRENASVAHHQIQNLEPARRQAADYEALDFLNKTNRSLGTGKPFSLEAIDIKSIALNVEERCNLRCTYCYAGEGNYGQDSTMQKDTAIQSITQLSRGKKSFHIAFFGGEPLLNVPLIKHVVLWCNSQTETKFTYGITTNGTLLNSSHLSFFKENGFTIKISYDGDQAQSIQRLNMDRKSNAADRVKNKINKYIADLDKIGMSMRATFGKEASKHFKESIMGMLSDFPSAVSYSKVSSEDFRQSLSLKEIEAIGRDLSEMIRDLLNQKKYETILRITNIAASIRIIHRGYVSRMTCGAGIGYLSVSTKGEYFLCHRFTESQEEKIGDVNSGLNYEALSKIQAYRSGQHKPCNTCWMQRYCRGGCFQENKMEHGDLFKPSEIFCRLQEIELTLALEVYLEIKNASPDLLDKFL